MQMKIAPDQHKMFSSKDRHARINKLDDTAHDFMSQLRGLWRPNALKIQRPNSQFPELVVTVPDSWTSIQIAPLYDVHIGSKGHDAELFEKHLHWIGDTENIVTFDGGDLIENATKTSVGAGVYGQSKMPNAQTMEALKVLSVVHHKMMFKLPGNHEDRLDEQGENMAQRTAQMLEIPYFQDYCFCSIRWRGNNFRLLAHHGSGAATTAGAQRMAARKDIAWARPFDIFWTGHLHQPLADVLYQTDQDQKTGLLVERNGFVIISPSYLDYFGGYAAKKRYGPGTRGLSVIELQEDGRMDVILHARGKRL